MFQSSVYTAVISKMYNISAYTAVISKMYNISAYNAVHSELNHISVYTAVYSALYNSSVYTTVNGVVNLCSLYTTVNGVVYLSSLYTAMNSIVYHSSVYTAVHHAMVAKQFKHYTEQCYVSYQCIYLIGNSLGARKAIKYHITIIAAILDYKQGLNRCQHQKSHIRETTNLQTDTDSRTDTTLETLRDFFFRASYLQKIKIKIGQPIRGRDLVM